MREENINLFVKLDKARTVTMNDEVTRKSMGFGREKQEASDHCPRLPCDLMGLTSEAIAS